MNQRIKIWSLLGSLIAATCGSLVSEVALALPNGTWLSQPQIRFHSSNNTLDQVMATIKAQQYKFVFLDYRNVSDAVQLEVSQSVRRQRLTSVVWVQSPQFRSLSVEQLVHEARNGDGIQVDDHFFANYTLGDFYALRSQYRKPIFCSIQPFQVAKVPPSGCNQLDVQCYSSKQLPSCLKLADRLNAMVSLSSSDTLKYVLQLGGRGFNVFLWPDSDRFFR
jgi:hypothetical protein